MLLGTVAPLFIKQIYVGVSEGNIYFEYEGKPGGGRGYSKRGKMLPQRLVVTARGRGERNVTMRGKLK